MHVLKRVQHKLIPEKYAVYKLPMPSSQHGTDKKINDMYNYTNCSPMLGESITLYSHATLLSWSAHTKINAIIVVGGTVKLKSKHKPCQDH